MNALVEMGPVVGVVALCAALGLARANYYRRIRRVVPEVVVVAAATDAMPVEGPGVPAVEGCLPEPPPGPPEPAPPILVAPAASGAKDVVPATVTVAAVAPVSVAGTADAVVDTAATPKARKLVPRALTLEQRDHVLALLNGPRFVDLAPGEVYATVLDEGTYLASERTMYRILEAHSEVRERRNLRRHPSYAAPELMASGVNQVWTWDITKLRGPAKGKYFHLYVMLDMYSRYIVGWMVSTSETAAQAEAFINETCARHKIPRGQLTIHADRGTSMRSKPVALLLADLGVIKSHSRPSVSDDNPYSEAQFKTLKYRPDFPDRFGSLEDARVHCARFCTWYNTMHHHSGIASLTPHDVFHGLADQRIKERAAVLNAAYAAHPERFVSAPPRPTPLPLAVWINKPKEIPLAKAPIPSDGSLATKPNDDDIRAPEAGPIHAIVATAIVEVGSELPFVKINDDKPEVDVGMNLLTSPVMGSGVTHVGA
jgi:putative transposase